MVVLWRCSGGVVVVLWRCSGGVVVVLWRYSGGVVVVMWRKRLSADLSWFFIFNNYNFAVKLRKMSVVKSMNQNQL